MSSSNLVGDPSTSAELRLLVGVTGSVDVLHLPQYLKGIRRRIECKVSLLLSRSVEQFISPASLALFADRVIAGERPEDWPSDKPSKIVADHNLMIVLPATANTLSVVAQGAAPNRLATVILASTFPVMFFPVMGASMWNKSAVRRNVDLIRQDGYVVVEPHEHHGYDFALGKSTSHPSLPPEDDVAAYIAEAWKGIKDQQNP